MRRLLVIFSLCCTVAAYGGWRVRIDPLPSFVYAGETRLLTASATYGGLTNASLFIQILPEGGSVTLRVAPQMPTSSGSQSMVSTGFAVLPLHINSDALTSLTPLTIRVVSEEGELLTARHHLLAGCAVDGVAVHRLGTDYFDETETPVTWVNTQRRWREERRWLLPRRVLRALRRRSQPVLWLGEAAGMGVEVSDGGDGLHGDGIELQSIMDLPLLMRDPPLTGLESTTLVVSLPADDIDNRLSSENIVRAVELAARWWRERHGETAPFLLLTPFPRPGQCRVTEEAAVTVREAGRRAGLPVIDLHVAILGVGTWESLYTADGVVHYDFPMSDVRELVAGVLAWRFPQPRQSVKPRLHVGSVLPMEQSGEWRNAGSAVSHFDSLFPGEAACWGMPSVAAHGVDAVALDVVLPPDAPADITAMLCMKDKDGLWFQSTLLPPLIPGQTNLLLFPVDGAAAEIDGGATIWDDYYRCRIRETGLGLFSGSVWSGRVSVVRAAVRTAALPTALPRIIRFRAPPQDTVCTGRYELAFILDGTTGLNPFEPEEVEVKAIFKSPTGIDISVDGFYYQSFTRSLTNERECLMPVGRPEWRVRFLPTESGVYSYRLYVKTPYGTVTSAPHYFEAQPSSLLAPVRASIKDPRLLELADGTPFYPIGLNIHAPFDVRAAAMEHRRLSPNHGTFAYDSYFERLSAVGANACVVWLAPWWLEIEWSHEWPGFGGLGDFNLGNAWRLDTLLESAERHGIRLHLVLENHGKYSLWVDSQWDSNPYNRANGGMLDSPEEFFTSTAASVAYQRKLRYLVARYASSPALMGFELVGEINLVGDTPRFANHPSHVRWVSSTARFLRKIDPYRRLLAVHYSNDWRTVDPAVAALPELDYLVGDIYKPGGNIVDWVTETARRNGIYGKPTFSTEFGGYWNGSTPARLEADLHAGLWSNFMTPTAGAPFFWWFEFVDRNDLYHHLGALVAFAQGEDRSGVLPAEELPVTHEGGRKVRALLSRRNAASSPGSNNTLAWLWVFDPIAMEVLPEERHAPVIEGAVLPLDLPLGTYNVEYWDTYAGRVMDVVRIIVPPGSPVMLPLPTFRRDLAAKIRVLTTSVPQHSAVDDTTNGSMQ